MQKTFFIFEKIQKYQKCPALQIESDFKIVRHIF